ncbi:MAG: GlmU family protein [Bacteroidota bacterium]
MNYILFDFHKDWENILPLTYTRPISEIRIGILTIKEKWDKLLDSNCSNLTEEYLKKKFTPVYKEDNFYINSSIIPNNQLVAEISELKTGQVLIKENQVISFRFNSALEVINETIIEKFEKINTSTEFRQIKFPWDIFRQNGLELESDYYLLTSGRETAEISKTNGIIGDNIFIEEGAKVEFATINAKDAFVYIGKDAEIMEGSVIRGSFALCNNSTLKIGAKIYGPTTIGPHSKVGGEVNNSVIFGYSNKGHDGFLGNSVLGEWCNLGAGTNNSNLKNNYAEVKLWNYGEGRFAKTGLQFCGLIMGDHSKCGINTMFNTGTVIGVNANIYGAGFPRNFVPSFSWGGALGFKKYQINKAFEVNHVVMSRRNLEFDETEQEILLNIFEATKKYRWF